MSATEQALWSALQTVVDPHTGRDFVSTKAIRHLQMEGRKVSLELVLGYAAQSQHAALSQALVAAAQTVPGVDELVVQVRSEIVAHAATRGVPLLDAIRNIVAVGSGKGGVGKSTTAINLALALAAEGANVGVLDSDIYGPSLPTMMGLNTRPESEDGKFMRPLLQHGLQLMSMGFLVEADKAVIWRGPMATQALEQLLRQTQWQALDYLVVDMPPGTGDIALTLCQRLPLTAALVVTTPQDLALVDAQKALKMFEKVGTPVLGVVENMALHRCSQCGHVEHIFGADGGRHMAERHGVPYLGALPLQRAIREHTDQGLPTVLADPSSDVARTYAEIARRMAAQLALLPKDYSSKMPRVQVEKQ